MKTFRDIVLMIVFFGFVIFFCYAAYSVFTVKCVEYESFSIGNEILGAEGKCCIKWGR